MVCVCNTVKCIICMVIDARGIHMYPWIFGWIDRIHASHILHKISQSEAVLQRIPPILDICVDVHYGLGHIFPRNLWVPAFTVPHVFQTVD